MKKSDYWRTLSNILFQNALILVLIICFSRLTYAVTKLTDGYSTFELDYVSKTALVVLASALAGQIYCLKRGVKDDSDKDK